MPTPKINESKQDFITRAIPIIIDEGNAETPEQAVAIAESLWEEWITDKRNQGTAAAAIAAIQRRATQVKEYIDYIKWARTRSSNVQSIKYEDKTRTLTVEFVSGAQYRYLNVPREKYDKMLILSTTGGSVGSWFYFNVRTSYTYRKIKG